MVNKCEYPHRNLPLCLRWAVPRRAAPQRLALLMSLVVRRLLFGGLNDVGFGWLFYYTPSFHVFLSDVFSPIFLGCVPIFDAFNFKPPFNRGLKQFVLPRGPGGSMLQGTAWSWRKGGSNRETKTFQIQPGSRRSHVFLGKSLGNRYNFTNCHRQFRVPERPKDLFWLSNSVPGCEDSKSGSCPQTPAVGWQMVLGIVLYRANHFQVRCGNKLGRSWKILEDLGRSWKILEAWSSHPKLAIGPIRAIGFLRFFPRSTSRILEALAVGVELLLTSHGGTTMDLSWCNNV